MGRNKQALGKEQTHFLNQTDAAVRRFCAIDVLIPDRVEIKPSVAGWELWLQTSPFWGKV